MNNSLAYRRHPVFPEVEMLCGHTVLHSYPRHFHDTLGLAVIHSGVELCWSRGAERVFQAGDVALFNSGEIHGGRPGAAEGWTYDMVYFPHDMVCRLLDRSACWLDAVSLRDPGVVALARQALRVSSLSSATNGSDTIAAEESMIALLARLVHRHRVHEPDPRAAALVRDFIDAHSDQAISGQQLTAVSSLSLEHTIRSFRRRYGITPHAYHQARRAETARQLLRSRQSLAEIALALGFYDQSHFTRWFRETQGVAPSAFRSAFRT
jgi:AraC-like DNA-binding protein